MNNFSSFFFGRNLNNKQNHKNQNIYHSNFCRCAAAAGEANEMPFKCFFISSQISKGVPHTRGGGVAKNQIAQRFQQLPSAVEIEVGGHFVLGGASGGECSRTGVCRAGAGWATSMGGAGWGSAVPLCGCTAINNLRK